MAEKLHRIVRYENMSEELAEAFNEKYPKGEIDYLQDIQRYPKADGTFFYAVTVEIPTTIYLVKIDIETDNIEDVEQWLSTGPDEEGDDDTTTDNNIPDAGDCPPGAQVDGNDEDEI